MPLIQIEEFVAVETVVSVGKYVNGQLSQGKREDDIPVPPEIS